MSTAPKYPEAPWEAQQFPELVEVDAPIWDSVEQAVRAALREPSRPAHNPGREPSEGSTREMMMVAKAYVLVAIDRVQPVEAREAYLVYLALNDVERVARAFHMRRTTMEARLEAVRAELHGILSARGLVGP